MANVRFLRATFWGSFNEQIEFSSMVVTAGHPKVLTRGVEYVERPKSKSEEGRGGGDYHVPSAQCLCVHCR